MNRSLRISSQPSCFAALAGLLLCLPATAMAQKTFEEACELERTRFEASTAGGTWSYFYCIDATNPHRPRSIFRSTGSAENDPDAQSGHLFAGRDIHGRVWHSKCRQVKVTTSLTPAPPNRIFRQQVEAVAAPTEIGEDPIENPCDQPVSTAFSALGGNDKYPKLTVQVLTEADEVEHNLKWSLRVEQVYQGAIRVGVLAGWSPWERTYGLAQGGGSNYVNITHGDSAGIPLFELMAGYSVYVNDIREFHRDVGFGWYFGVGLLSADQTGELSVLSTLLATGPELVVGTDFSMAFVAMLRRGKWLRSELSPGSSVATASVADITEFGVWPAFGIVLNFSADFMKVARWQ